MRVTVLGFFLNLLSYKLRRLSFLLYNRLAGKRGHPSFGFDAKK